jgi:hypothetical protein
MHKILRDKFMKPKSYLEQHRVLARECDASEGSEVFANRRCEDVLRRVDDRLVASGDPEALELDAVLTLWLLRRLLQLLVVRSDDVYER